MEKEIEEFKSATLKLKQEIENLRTEIEDLDEKRSLKVSEMLNVVIEKFVDSLEKVYLPSVKINQDFNQFTNNTQDEISSLPLKRFSTGYSVMSATGEGLQLRRFSTGLSGRSFLDFKKGSSIVLKHQVTPQMLQI